LNPCQGGAIAPLTLERGFTQEELADRAGLNRNYVGMIEREENASTVDTLEALAEALEVEAIRLIES
jgi:transcriptional regulator with XRE-family HTH domain